MKLSEELLASLKKHGILSPTKIQESSIPIIMEGRDMQAQSETGSGKTLAFGIPIMEKAAKGGGLQALIISPTRELAKQIANEFHKFGQNRLHVTTVYGGISIEPQIKDVRRCEVVVGTPGRILDLLSRDSLDLSKLKWLVLDEADRMLDMGFIEDVEKIISQTPKNRQTLLFSATLAREILDLSRRYLKDPVAIDVELKNTDYLLKQFYYAGSKEDKLSVLVHMLNQGPRKLTIVFVRTKRTADWLSGILRRQNVNSVALHGDMSQNQRERAVRDFQEGKFDVLIATDVAARGLHINHVSHVYNFDLPNSLEAYTHRIGRTARLDKEGSAITLLADGDDPNVWDKIMRFYDDKIQKLDLGEVPRLKLAPRRHYGQEGGREGRFRPSFRHGGGYQGRSRYHGGGQGHRSREDGEKREGFSRGGGFRKKRFGSKPFHSRRDGGRRDERRHGHGKRPERKHEHREKNYNFALRE